MSLTVTQAAKAGRCHPSNITALYHTGKLTGEQSHPKAHIRITMSRAQVRETVRNATPRAGFHKNGHKPIRRQKARPKLGSGMAPLVRWLTFSPEIRDTLSSLGDRFTLTELRLLLTL